MIILLVFTAVYFTGALFDLSGRNRVNTFVFQPSDLSSSRIGRPVPLEELSDKFVRERLIKKFVNEYFYVVPESGNVALRQRSDSVMHAMAETEVYKTWARDVTPELEDLSNKKILRRVHVIDPILKPDNYYVVNYQLETYLPNDFKSEPIVKSGTMYLIIRFEKGIREERAGKPFDAGKYLESGGDPSSIFKFRVEEVK